MIGLRKGGALVEQRAFLRKGGALVEQDVYLRTASGLKLISSPAVGFSATVSETDVFGGRSVAATVTVTTFSVTVAPVGGVPPYSYNWARTDAGGGTWDILVDGASARFRRAVEDGGIYSATFVCTVTDSRGASAAAPSVSATVRNFGDLLNGGTL